MCAQIFVRGGGRKRGFPGLRRDVKKKHLTRKGVFLRSKGKKEARGREEKKVSLKLR